jgi:hypothetical protein
MTDERRKESLWTAFIQEADDRRDGGSASTGFEELHDLLQRDHQPDDLLNSWLESAFWSGYSKDFRRLALFKNDIRDRFGGKTITIEPHNATSLEIQRVLREMGTQRTSVAPIRRGNGHGGDA